MQAPHDAFRPAELHPGRWADPDHYGRAVDVDALTDADAIPDGFETAASLKKELRTIYGE